jgi:hypothetical protein
VITLVSATYTLDHLQEDGRHWVAERFVPSEGEPVESRYLAAEDEDFDAHLAAMGDGLLMKWNRPADPPAEGDA